MLYNIVYDDITIDISELEHILKYWHIVSKYISIMKAIKQDRKIYDKLINSKDYVITEATYGNTVHINILICRAYISHSTNKHFRTQYANRNLS